MKLAFIIFSLFCTAYSVEADHVESPLTVQSSTQQSEIDALQKKVKSLEDLIAGLTTRHNELSRTALQRADIVIGMYNQDIKSTDKRVTFPNLLKGVANSNRGRIGWVHGATGGKSPFQPKAKYAVWAYGFQHDKKDYKDQNTRGQANCYLGVFGLDKNQPVSLGYDHGSKNGAVDGYQHHLFIAIRQL